MIAHCAYAYPQLRSSKRAGFAGIAVFNDYVKQGNTVCGPLGGKLIQTMGKRYASKNCPTGDGGAYAAAAADLSPDISGGKCSGTMDMSICNGQSPAAGYQGPSCPTNNCGKCYTVTNKGSMNGEGGGVGKSIVVQIVDSCPSTHAQNYCKSAIPKNQRCMDSSTNQLDIDVSAYQALTGAAFGSVSSPLILASFVLDIGTNCCRVQISK